jgi:hypothetical protein
MTGMNANTAEPRRSRRRFLLEVAGAAVLLAIPLGAALATAQPIVNPPGRDELDVVSDQRKEVLEQRAATDEKAAEPTGWEKAREERKKARKARDGKSATEEQEES